MQSLFRLDFSSSSSIVRRKLSYGQMSRNAHETRFTISRVKNDSRTENVRPDLCVVGWVLDRTC